MEQTPDLWELERSLGGGRIAGVDEAGRGPLAGPVCAAAVILPFGCQIEGLNDSKKLTDARRRALYDVICEKALGYGIAFATVAEIEEYNILQATFLAMRRALSKLAPPPEVALIDGNRLGEFPVPAQAVVHGDALSANIAAASILAKVTRDRYMEQYDAAFPQYGFAVHKGYGTRRHYAAIDRYGPCALHRPSFLKKHHAAR